MAEALAHLEDAVEYPESDDTPVESMKQWNVVAQVVMALRRFFGGGALVAANLGVYYRRGDNTKLVVPDLFVTLGPPKIDTPDVYLTWEQGKPPDFALEVASKTTFRRDRREKIEIYRALGVKEYFLHDATDRFLKPRLQGFRAVGAGQYAPVVPTVAPKGVICLHSGVLNVHFRTVEGEAAPQLLGPDGELLLSHEDAAAEERRLRHEHERGQVEAERGRLEAEREASRLREQLAALRAGRD